MNGGKIKMTVKLPSDLCSSIGIGTIRKYMGVREENFIANVCRIKETSQEVIDKFTKITQAQQQHPDAPIDISQEIGFYNQRLGRIQNLAQASRIR